MPTTFVAYTDGSFVQMDHCSVYGSAAIIAPINTSDWTILKSAGNKPEYISYRNVAGELFAAINLFNYIRDNLPTCRSLIFNYDYEGVGNWLKGTWKTKRPLTQAYKKFYDDYIAPGINVTFTHVYGHSTDEGNRIVDHLAKEAIKDFLKSKGYFTGG